MDEELVRESKAITNSILTRLSAEPANRRILYELLVRCEEGRTMDELDGLFRGITAGSTPQYALSVYVSWLTQWNALEKTGDDREVIFRTTPEGRTAAGAVSPTNRLGILFGREPRHAALYTKVLRVCVEAKTRQDVESSLDGVLEETGFYPSYFIGELEEAGGLVWNGKWQTTDSGTERLMADLLTQENGGNE